MSDCFFCGAFVGEVNGDGGCKGRTVGTKDICEQCLGELKHWLNGTLPRSPGMRETPIENEETNETTTNSNETNSENDSESRETNDDPFSAKPEE